MCIILFQQHPRPMDKRPPIYRQNYGPEQMKRAYQMWKEDGVSVYKAAKTCGIPVGTLRDRTTLGRCDPNRHKSGRSPLLSSNEEAAFVAHVKQVAACGYGYTRREIAELAGETAFFLKTKDTSAPVLEKWVYDFLKRWPDLKITNATGLPMFRACTATRETMDNYYKELLFILQKYELLEKPHRIFNVDETGISSDHIPAAPQGHRSLAVAPQRSATVINCVGASGQFLPPYVVFKGKRMTDDLLAGALPGTQGTVSESGSTNSRIFQTYLADHFLKHVPTNKYEPLLLLYDGHSSHVTVPLIEWAQKYNIILFLLPAHTRYLLQPLDIGVCEPFKMAYFSECQIFLRKSRRRVIKRQDICHLIAHAISRTVTPGKIIACFRCTGIFPFNASVVTG